MIAHIYQPGSAYHMFACMSNKKIMEYLQGPGPVVIEVVR